MKEHNSLEKFIYHSQFEQKTDIISYLTTKWPIVLILIGLYNLIIVGDQNSPIKHLIMSVGPFILILVMYNKSRIKKKAVLSGLETNPSFFNRLFAKASKHVTKQPYL